MGLVHGRSAFEFSVVVTFEESTGSFEEPHVLLDGMHYSSATYTLALVTLDPTFPVPPGLFSCTGIA